MRDLMNSVEQKSLEYSIQAYRRMVRVYPKQFLSQFEEPLLQAFGDLARRALRSGGVLRLIFLWMGVLRDLGVSAIREHLNVSPWICPPHVRLRWIVACMFGFGIGGILGDRLGMISVPFSSQIHSFALMVILGLFQSAWALRLSGKDVLRWTLATTVGCFALALPFRFLLNGFPPNRLSLANEMVFLALLGAGIGLLQFLVFPRNAFKAWRWIPATLSGVLGGNFASMGSARLVYTSTSLFRYGLVLFIGGAVLGVFTCFALESILRSRGDTEGAIES